MNASCKVLMPAMSFLHCEHAVAKSAATIGNGPNDPIDVLCKNVAGSMEQ
jgi:hypothetical protein